MVDFHSESIDRLFKVILNLKTVDDCYDFFEDVCTIKEIQNMTNTQILAQIRELNEYEALLEEVKAAADAIKDSIKAEMEARDTEELTVGMYTVRWTSVLSNRFDTVNFKRDYAEVYKAYQRQIYSKRFTVSC